MDFSSRSTIIIHMQIITSAALMMLPILTFAQTDGNDIPPPPPVEETAPEQTVDVAPTAVKKIPMTLIWNSVEGAKNYRVMISRTTHFYQSRAFKTKKKRFPVEVEPTGTYYWQVVALDDDGNEISDKAIVAFKPKNKGKSRTQLTLRNQPMEKTYAEENDSTNPAESFESKPENKESKSASSDYTTTGFSVSVALEAGSVSLKQAHPSIVDIESTGFMFPSFSLGLETPKVFEHYFAKLFLQQNIASFKSDTSGITFQDGDFRWLSYGVDFVGAWSTGRWTWMPHIGVSQMTTPFFVSTGTALSIQDVDYTFGGAGIAAMFTPDSSRWHYSLDLSYLTKMSAESSDFSSIDATKATQLSAEVTASLALSPVLQAHFYLKGQMLDFEETVVYNSVTSPGTRESTYVGAGARLSVSF